jgi:hypothetical protein
MAAPLILGAKDSMVALVLIGAFILILVPISNALQNSFDNSAAQLISNYAPLALLFILFVFIWSRLGGSSDYGY